MYFHKIQTIYAMGLKYKILLVFTFLTYSSLFSQWGHFVTNFKKDVYKGSAQTWQIQVDSNDNVYFANKNGILEYNGSDWSMFPLQNKSDVRSIYISEKDNRVYAGGELEFGYYQPNDIGKKEYSILSDDFYLKDEYSGVYWGIYQIDNTLYFISDWYVIKKVDENYSVIESEYKIDCSAIINDILYLGTTDGLMLLVGNTLLPHENNDVIKNKTIRAIDSFQDKLIIATAFDGLFLATPNKIEHFPIGYEDFMKQNEIFSIATSKNYLAIGTIHKGLLLLNFNNNQIEYFNEENGLQNNTILSLAFDKDENIWLGLDNGIDFITLNSPITNLYSHPNSKGAGYVALKKDNNLYLGTNRGLYYTNWPVTFDEKMVEIEYFSQLSGQVWGLANNGDDIFCMHDKGLFVIQNNKVEKIEGLRGALSYIEHENDSNKCWVTTYNSFFLLEKKNNKWSVISQIPEINNWPKNAVFEDAETIWVRVVNEGVEKIKIDTTLNSYIESKIYTKEDGFESVVNLYIHKIDNEVYFSTESGIYKYDDKNDKIIKSNLLKEELSKNIKLITKVNNKIYALSSNYLTILETENNNKIIDSTIFTLPLSQVETINYYESLNVLNDSLAIIPNEYGFALLNNNHVIKSNLDNLFIKNIYSTYPKDSLLFKNNFQNNIPYPQIQYNNNAIKFEYDVRWSQRDMGITFSHRLLPDKTWSEPSTSRVKEYNNLKEGEYIFEVKAHFNNNVSNVTSFDFKILPPWYRTIYAKLAYLLLFLSCIFALYLVILKRQNIKKIKELAIKEEEIKKKENELIEEKQINEQKIIELKNENLEQELKHKSQEMANLMINLSRKNEILIDIKDKLNKIIPELKTFPDPKPKQMITSLNSEINTNIQSDDLLKKFEEQFDLVHNNFTNQIRLLHPNLTVTEIKMCTFLKMGLSTKEIAPLLNISIRGVETIRYRMRKKMKLEKEANLMEYLNTLTS